MVSVKLNSKGNIVVNGFTTSVKVSPSDSLPAIESKIKQAAALAKKKDKISSNDMKVVFAQAKKLAKKIQSQAKGLGKVPSEEEKPEKKKEKKKEKPKKKKPKEKKKKPEKKKKEEKAEAPPPITFGKEKKEALPKKPAPKKEEKKPPVPVPIKPAPEKKEPEIKIPKLNWDKQLSSTLLLTKKAKKPSNISKEIQKFAGSFWDLEEYVTDNRDSLTLQMFGEFYQLPEFKAYLYSAACENSDAEELMVYLQKNGSLSKGVKHIETANLVMGDYLSKIASIHPGYKKETGQIGGIGKSSDMNPNLLLSSLLYLRRWYLVNKKKLAESQISLLMLKPLKEPPKTKKEAELLKH
jgi:hypothetical protein